jgi:predicted restriction endonuclease
MTLLENYLDNYDNKELCSSIYSMYKKFDYDDEDIYHMDLDFLLNNIYNIKIIEERHKRMGQQEFKKKILELYNNKCIVTGNNCCEELEAAHIIPVSEEEDYSLDNGLLLERNIHVTFDKYFWSINPDTFIIESLNKGTIANYNGNKLDLPDNLKYNLRKHYNKFKNIQN